MIKFDYLVDDRIARVTDVFSSFNEPSSPIPAEIIELTNITDEMVLGHRIDPEAVSTFVSDAVLVIAHNASFDRKFAERYWPIFERKAWACSATEIDWRRHGFDGSRLGYLLNGSGLFHQAHRAIDDCRALIEILSKDVPKIDRPAFAVLLERARQRTVRIWAEQSPFELKDALKKRGYRWSDGADGRPRSWYIDVDEVIYLSDRFRSLCRRALVLEKYKALLLKSETDDSGNLTPSNPHLDHPHLARHRRPKFPQAGDLQRSIEGVKHFGYCTSAPLEFCADFPRPSRINHNHRPFRTRLRFHFARR